MIEKLLEMAEGRLVIPLVVVVVGTVLTRGLFSLTRSRSQDRRDFLELFKDYEKQGDLWISVAVRHCFGAHLPTALIRQLMASPQPGRALQDIANAWGFLDMDDETAEMKWRKGRLSSAKRRKFVIRVLLTFYFLFAASSLWLAYLCISDSVEGRALWIGWAYVVIFGVVAFASLNYSDDLEKADAAARRWLGMP